MLSIRLGICSLIAEEFIHILRNLSRLESRGRKRMFKKKWIALNTSILIGVGSLIAIPSASASYETQIQQVEQKIVQNQSKLDQLKQQIVRVEQALIDNNNQVVQTEEDIKTTQADIKKLEEEILALNESIKQRNEILKKRAQSLQESGGTVSYIQVLFGSEDFGDFLDRAFAVTKIAQADQDLLEQHELDKKAVQDKQTSVNTKLEDLTGKKAELDAIRSTMIEQQNQAVELKKQVEVEQQQNINEKSSLEAKQERDRERQRQLSVAVSTIPTNESTYNVREVAVSIPTNSGSVNDVIKAGYKYIGNSVYVFGGGRSSYDIANGRFDCSGFVHWAFSQAGIKVGASTDSLKNQGTRVSSSQMQPGDLVFFDTYKKDGHVGIYVGGGKFIGSQSSTGVAIADMTSGYWAQKFNGRVNRIIK